MAAKQKKAQNKTKLKQGKQKSVNKWVILAGVAIIAIVGVLVVRYSSASSNIWSIRSYSVTHTGGSIIQKTNGSVYWQGPSGAKVTFNAPSAGTYCLEGSYNSRYAGAKIEIRDALTQWEYNVVGEQGQTYSHCKRLGQGQKYSITVNYGQIIFNRVRKI